MQVINKKINEIKPYEKNPRKNDEAVKYVANSIKEFGFKVPIVIDKDGVIIAGHTRYKAAKRLKMKEVPCIMADDLTPEQVKAFRLADNKVGEVAEWDDDLLSEELDGILSLDMGDFGFDDDETEESDGKAHDDEYDADLAKPEARTKTGDLYILGNHRLLCGDSTKEESYAKLMGEERADLVITDPPYNVSVGSKNEVLAHFDKGGAVKEDIAGDSGMTDQQCYETLWRPAFECMRKYAKDKCAIYASMAQGGTKMTMMITAAIDAGWNIKHGLVWVKNVATFSLGRLDYDYKHEPIMYGWNKSHEFYAKDYKTSVLEEEMPNVDEMSEKEAKRLLKRIIREAKEAKTSTLYYNKPNKSTLHPTMKPIELWGELIGNSSEKGGNVLDAFGGSGTTMITCEQMGRKCYMMEIDPHYCDVIIDRWEQLTGEKAIKAN